MFHFACRHHILELVAEAAFATCFGPSTGPDIAIFKRFQASWNFIDQNKFEPMMPGDIRLHSIRRIFQLQRTGHDVLCPET
jgi:hypothetical protein